MEIFYLRHHISVDEIIVEISWASFIIKSPMCAGSSGDEEVSGYMGGPYTPVQFCTSPPLNVYKPRRSQSPPPKLFHMAAASTSSSNGGGGCGAVRQTAAGLAAEARAMRASGCTTASTERGSGGAFRPRFLGGDVAASSLPLVGELPGNGDEEEVGVDGGAAAEEGGETEHRASPSKRHRATPRPHNIPRPCLDFEKMQQVNI